MPIRRQSSAPAKPKKVVRSPGAKKTAKKSPALIDLTMPVAEIVSLHPFAADVLAQYGLACANCALGGYESLEEGCTIHELTEAERGNLIADLNFLLSGKAPPMRNEKLILTAAAAGALRNVVKESGKVTCMLRVMGDGHGGYCLEFTEAKTTDDIIALHPDFPDVSLIADPKLLKGMGGATVDVREGRFKLDIGKQPKKMAMGMRKEVNGKGKRAKRK